MLDLNDTTHKVFPQKKLIKKISSTKGSLEKGLCVVEGWKCFEEALQKSVCKEVLVRSELKERFQEKKFKIDGFTHLMNAEELKKVSHLQNPEGILGVFERPKVALNSPIATPKSLHVALFNWSDPNNVGALIRSARGLGVSSVSMFGNGPDFFSPKVIRTSMGSVFHINLHKFELNYKLSKEWSLFCAEANGEDSLKLDIDRQKASMLFIGNETHGFRGEMPLNSKVISIVLQDSLESLSAPIAATLLIDRLQNKLL